MKKFVLLCVCLFLLVSCASPRYISEKEAIEEMEIEEIKREAYRQGYMEGYDDATETIIYEMPWDLIDKEEFEHALYEVFEDGAYAEEIRDQILSYCDIYECVDFKVEFSDSNEEIDYNY